MDRSLSSLNIGPRVYTDGDKDLRGPLGLNLLYSPPDPLVDFVFVHGLRGGSRKTWTFQDRPETYWPQQWLPNDSRFRNVRIHSFGYSADWGSTKESLLSVHDFGQALLGELANSPDIAGGEQQTAIVLIGHSMGGIVIKKALLLAKQDPNCSEIYARIHSMFFLATPHRGADSANLLKNLLRVTGPKAYINDLQPGSTSSQVINDEFRHAYGNVQLYSFFETLQMSHLGIVVDRESAVLGLPGERVQLLNADHRHVCKFADKQDSNYLSLRNALVSAIDSIERSMLSGRRNTFSSQMQALSQYLDIPERPDAVLASVTNRQTEGTCLWLNNNKDFQQWLHLESAQRIFYLEGEPASGKSTAAGHVIRTLEDSGTQHAFFFFKHGDTTQSTLAVLLRSFAWQMAAINAECRAELLYMEQQNHFFDKNDEGSVWRNIFVARILKLKWQHPCFWTIDALDECTNYASLFPLISKVEQQHPLRIFVTGRPLLAVDRLFTREKLPRLTLVMSITDSLEDITIFLQANVDLLPAENEDEREMLLRRILNRSNGNFLWTSLVLQELADTPSVQQAYEVLDSVPTGMDDLYSRILNALMANNHKKDIARAILKWIICAMRPLSVEELKGALDLDINATLPRLDQMIPSITGNLVLVDSSNKLQLVHQTVRAFLMREDATTEALKNFGIVRHRDNLHISHVCLAYLNGMELRTPRHRKPSLPSRSIKRSPFAPYIMAHFSDHVSRSSVEDSTLLENIRTFLNTNSLTWIESIANIGDLSPVVRTAANLRNYLKKRAKTLPPVGQAVDDVVGWTSDLERLVASFGKAVLMSPTSIQFLIPPVCPTSSMIFQQFAQYPGALRFSGASHTEWDDRVSCVIFANVQVLSVASHDNSFAVGLSDGTARLLSLSATQEQRSFKHGDQVRQVRFSATDQHLATSSRKRICMWDLASGKKRWECQLDSPILCLDFTASNNSFIALTNANTVRMWNATTGELTQQFDVCDIDEQTEQPHPQKRVATHADFCPGLNLLAVGYRQRPVVIWELTDDSCEYVGSYLKNSQAYYGPLLFALRFNPKPELNLLAASFDDGDLVVFNPYTQETQVRVTENVARMHGSNDGTTLVTGNGSGRVKLLDFETLRCLYSIDSYEMAVRDFAFSSNSQSMFEVRGNHCNIWQPPVLSRVVDTDDVGASLFSDVASLSTPTVEIEAHNHERMITAFSAPRDSNLVFCGREDGSVRVHSLHDGKMLEELTRHNLNVSVRFLAATPKDNLVVSVDISSRVLVHAKDSQSDHFELRADRKLRGIVREILVKQDGTKLLISTEDGNELYELPSLELINSIAKKSHKPTRWAQHPLKPACLLRLSSFAVEVYEWATLGKASAQIEDPRDNEEATENIVQVETAVGCRNFCVLRSYTKTELLGRTLEVYNSAAMKLDNLVISPLARYQNLATKDIKILIGIHETALFFLTHEGWLCSIDISGTQEQSYIRHFFVPFKYHNSGGTVSIAISSSGVVVLSFKSDMVIFENGLNFVERIPFKSVTDRPAASSTRLSMKSTLQRTVSAPEASAG